MSRPRMRALSPVRLLGVLAGLLVVAGLVLYVVPSDDYIFLPDRAHPVAPLVRVQGGHDPAGPGGIYFVDVFQRKASVLESLFPSIRSGATLVPARLIVPPGVSDTALRRADLRAMSVSQRVAAAVALRRLGYTVVARPRGVIVVAVAADSHAAGKLQPADVIVSVNGKTTLTVGALRRQLAHARPGDVVRLGIDRGGEKLVVAVKTLPDPLDKKRALIGFSPDQSVDIHLPLKVEIEAGNVGGPSAGLPFALEVMEELGRDVDHGYKVAATGQINLDGTISPIGGVKQKTYGVRKTGADVFLVPAGDNAREARRYADGLRIIPVKSFPQALRALATLPPKG
jgi:PDZ domain-containing protein